MAHNRNNNRCGCFGNCGIWGWPFFNNNCNGSNKQNNCGESDDKVTLPCCCFCKNYEPIRRNCRHYDDCCEHCYCCKIHKVDCCDPCDCCKVHQDDCYDPCDCCKAQKNDCCDQCDCCEQRDRCGR